MSIVLEEMLNGMAKSQLNSGKSGCRGLSEEERRAQGCPLISAQGIVHTQ